MTITFRDERTGLDLGTYLGVGLTHGTWPWTLAANLCIAAMAGPLYRGALAREADLSMREIWGDWLSPAPLLFQRRNDRIQAERRSMYIPTWSRVPTQDGVPARRASATLDVQLADAVAAADRLGAEPDAVCTVCSRLVQSTHRCVKLRRDLPLSATNVRFDERSGTWTWDEV